MKETIDNNQKLQDFCDGIQQGSFICVDTEFMRQHTYWPHLCLLQVATPQAAVLIDPLAAEITLDPLFSIFQNPSITKVLHASRQDVEILYQKMGTLPVPLFDTQVAAMALGFPYQISYQSLVEKMLGKTINKSAQRTDWRKRPLTAEQKEYAFYDVIFLKDLYLTIQENLEQLGRQTWIMSAMDALSFPEHYTSSHETIFANLRLETGQSRHKLSPFSAHALKALIQFREEVAAAADLPRRKIISDSVLFDIAQCLPHHLERVEAILSRHAADLSCALKVEKLQETIQNILSTPPPIEPLKTTWKKPDPHLKKLIEGLRHLLATQCEKVGIAPELVATRSILEDIAQGIPLSPALMNDFGGPLFFEQAIRWIGQERKKIQKIKGDSQHLGI